MTSFHNNMCNVSNIFMHANIHRAKSSLNYYAGKNIGGKYFQETERSGRSLKSTDKAKSFFVWKVFRSCNRSVPIAPNKWNFRKTTNVSLISPFQTKLKEAHPKPPSSFCLGRMSCSGHGTANSTSWLSGISTWNYCHWGRFISTFSFNSVTSRCFSAVITLGS